MPKMKTHKGTKKVLNVKPSGTVTIGRQGGRHNTGKKSAKFNRKKRTRVQLSKGDAKRLKSIIQSL